MAYAEYFSFQRIVACLSSNYDGARFSRCYAVDPITGKELDIDVRLKLTPEDIAAIYAYEKMDSCKAKRALDSLIAVWKERAEKKAIYHAIDEAVKYALENHDAQPGEVLSEDDIGKFSSLMADKLIPFVNNFHSSRAFSSEQLRDIAAHMNRSACNKG